MSEQRADLAQPPGVAGRLLSQGVAYDVGALGAVLPRWPALPLFHHVVRRTGAGCFKSLETHLRTSLKKVLPREEPYRGAFAAKGMGSTVAARASGL